MAKNYTEQEVKGLFRQNLAAVGITEIQSVTLGAVVGGKMRIPVPGADDEVYVTLDNRSYLPVKRGSANVADAPGRHVKIGRVAGNSYLQLLDPDYGAASPSGGTSTSGTKPHANQHVFDLRWRNAPAPSDVSDPLYLPSRQLSDLLIVPYSGMIAGVRAGKATVNGVEVDLPNGAILSDLTGDIPAAAGDAVIVRVELASDGTVSTTVGTDYTEPVTDLDALGNAPARTSGRNTLGYLWLENGMTAISWHHILPAPLGERVGGGPGAPNDATYILKTAHTGLPNAQALSALSTGLLKVNTTSGLLESVTNSAGVAALISDKTGSGALVFGTSPTIVTPTIASFANATHDHSNAAGGGTLNASVIGAGTLIHERGGLEADVSAYNGLVKISGGATSAVTAPSGAIVGTTDTQTLTNKTLTAPLIGNFTNATHTHQATSSGGQLDASSVFNVGAVPIARGGTGSDYSASSGFPAFNGAGGITLYTAPSGVVVGTTDTQTLTNKTLTSPTINTATISGGTINNAPIGSTTSNTGTFTSLVALSYIAVDTTVANTDANIYLNGDAGVNKQVLFQSGGAFTWAFLSNSADDFAIGRFVGGVFTDFPLYITDDVGDIIMENWLGVGATPLYRMHVTEPDAATNTVVNVMVVGHNTSGTPAAGFGTALVLQGESSTTADTDMARVYSRWNTATHASRAADLVLTAYNTSNEREGLRIRGGASGPEVGMFGVTPVARSTGWTVTNPVTRKTFSTTTVTLPQLAEVVGTLVDYLKTLGPLGA